MNNKLLDTVRKSPYFKNNIMPYYEKYGLKNIEKNYKSLLLHFSRTSDENLALIDLLKKRHPRDTYPLINNMINQKSKEKFGYKIRNAMFCYPNGNLDKTDFGGTYYAIFPLKKYKLFYNLNVIDYTLLYGYADTHSGKLRHKEKFVEVLHKQMSILFVKTFKKELREFMYDNNFDKLFGSFNEFLKEEFLSHINEIYDENIFEFFGVLHAKSITTAQTQLKKLINYFLTKNQTLLGIFIRSKKCDKQKLKNIIQLTTDKAFSWLNNDVNNYINNVQETEIITPNMISKMPEIMLKTNQVLRVTRNYLPVFIEHIVKGK